MTNVFNNAKSVEINGNSVKSIKYGNGTFFEKAETTTKHSSFFYSVIDGSNMVFYLKRGGYVANQEFIGIEGATVHLISQNSDTSDIVTTSDGYVTTIPSAAISSYIKLVFDGNSEYEPCEMSLNGGT